MYHSCNVIKKIMEKILSRMYDKKKLNISKKKYLLKKIPINLNNKHI